MRVRCTPTSWLRELHRCSPREPAARRLSFTMSRVGEGAAGLQGGVHSGGPWGAAAERITRAKGVRSDEARLDLRCPAKDPDADWAAVRAERMFIMRTDGQRVIGMLGGMSWESSAQYRSGEHT